MSAPRLFLAEFESPETLLEAARRARQAGLRGLDAHTPFAVEGMTEALGLGPDRIRLAMLVGGLISAVFVYWLHWFSAVVDYPINSGGRPLHSWPSFIPITFELTVLAAAFGAVLGMLALNGLPMPYHPVFNVPEFKRASRDRFFLCIEARDPAFQVETARQFLESLGPRSVLEVPR